MAYVKNTWVANTTVVSASNLNHMEDGIAANDTALNTAVVRHDAAQTLTDTQKQTARGNIAAAKISISGNTLVVEV